MRDKKAPMIGEILTGYLERRKLKQRLQQASVINDWQELVGQQLAKVTEPDSVDREGTLRVRVQSAAWLQELQLMSPTIIKEFARKGKGIKRIWWTLGTMSATQNSASRSRSLSRVGMNDMNPDTVALAEKRR